MLQARVGDALRFVFSAAILWDKKLYSAIVYISIKERVIASGSVTAKVILKKTRYKFRFRSGIYWFEVVPGATNYSSQPLRIIKVSIAE